MREIDYIIDYVKGYDRLSAIHKQVLINRIDPSPTIEELDRAKEDLGHPVQVREPWAKSQTGWKVTGNTVTECKNLWHVNLTKAARCPDCDSWA